MFLYDAWASSVTSEVYKRKAHTRIFEQLVEEYGSFQQSETLQQYDPFAPSILPSILVFNLVK